MGKREVIRGVYRYLASYPVFACVLAGVSSCAGPWEKPQPVAEGSNFAPNLAVAQEPITTPVQGLYVVSNGGGINGYCDDVLFTNDQAGAIQACIDKANANGGGTVMIRGGIYSSGTWPLSLKRFVTLKSDGRQAATLAPWGGAQLIGTVEDDTAIEGLGFDLLNLTQGGIRLGAGFGLARNSIRIENNFISSGSTSTRSGIYDDGSVGAYFGLVIRDNTFASSSSGGAFNAIDLNASGGSSGPFDYLRIQDNNFNFGSGGVVRINGSTTGPGARNVAISGNTLRTSSTSLWGMKLAGLGAVMIANNYLSGFTNPLDVQPGGATSCAPMVTGNFLGGDLTSGLGCIQNLTMTGNSTGHHWSKTGKAGVLVRAHRESSQTFTAGVDTTLTFTNADVNYGGDFTASSGTFLAPAPGWYRIHVCARFSGTNFSVGDSADVNIYAGGGHFGLNRVIASGGSSFTSCADDLVQLALGGTAYATVNASGTANTRTVMGSGSYSTYITIERVSD